MKNYTAKILLILFFMPSAAVLPGASSEETTELHQAARNGNCSVIQHLLDQGADVNARDIKRWTPLHIAATFGHAFFIQELIRLRADIINLDAQDAKGVTALFFAALQNQPACIEVLLQAGANPNLSIINSECYGFTALHIAAKKNHTACVETLVQHPSTNINACAKKNLTPLHLAAQYGATHSIQKLLLADADLNAQTSNQETPENVAYQYGSLAAARLLKEVRNLGPTAITSVDKDENDLCFFCNNMFYINEVCASLGCGHDFHQECFADWFSECKKRQRNLCCSTLAEQLQITPISKPLALMRTTVPKNSPYCLSSSAPL